MSSRKISKSVEKPEEEHRQPGAGHNSTERTEITPDALDKAWLEFTGQLKGEGTRIVSMFNSIKPEFENKNIISVHLSNADQKDTFVQNYKHSLIKFLEDRYIIDEIEIETNIDLAETNDILYTDEQKSNYLFKKYPVLKEMKKNFNLDINLTE